MFFKPLYRSLSKLDTGRSRRLLKRVASKVCALGSGHVCITTPSWKRSCLYYYYRAMKNYSFKKEVRSENMMLPPQGWPFFELVGSQRERGGATSQQGIPSTCKSVLVRFTSHTTGELSKPCSICSPQCAHAFPTSPSSSISMSMKRWVHSL